MGAVLNIKDFSRGASRQAIKKYIEANHKKIMNPAMLRKALSKAVGAGDLLQEGNGLNCQKRREPSCVSLRPNQRRKRKRPQRKRPRKRLQRKRRKRRQRKRRQRKRRKRPQRKRQKRR